MTPPKNEKSNFFNYFEFLLLSEIEAAVCQSQLIFLDSPFTCDGSGDDTECPRKSYPVACYYSALCMPFILTGNIDIFFVSALNL